MVRMTEVWSCCKGIVQHMASAPNDAKITSPQIFLVGRLLPSFLCCSSKRLTSWKSFKPEGD